MEINGGDIMELMELEFNEINSSYNNVSDDIYRRIVNWDYLPTPATIRDTFHISEFTANKLFWKLFAKKFSKMFKQNKTLFWQYTPFKQKYKPFKRIQRELTILRNLQNFRVWRTITKSSI